MSWSWTNSGWAHVLINHQYTTFTFVTTITNNIYVQRQQNYYYYVTCVCYYQGAGTRARTLTRCALDQSLWQTKFIFVVFSICIIYFYGSRLGVVTSERPRYSVAMHTSFSVSVQANCRMVLYVLNASTCVWVCVCVLYDMQSRTYWVYDEGTCTQQHTIAMHIVHVCEGLAHTLCVWYMWIDIAVVARVHTTTTQLSWFNCHHHHTKQ